MLVTFSSIVEMVEALISNDVVLEIESEIVETVLVDVVNNISEAVDELKIVLL